MAADEGNVRDGQGGSGSGRSISRCRNSGRRTPFRYRKSHRPATPTHSDPGTGSASDGRGAPGRLARWLQLGEAFARPDREVEPVLARHERAGPAGIEGARRLIGEVEVEDQRAAR